MSRANEYGVFESTEQVVLVNKGRLSVAIIRLAEHEGRWHWGLDVQYGGLRGGAGGYGWAPSVDGFSEPTKAAAIKAAKEFVKDRANKTLSAWPDLHSYLQPIIDACGPQQRSLFQEAS